MGAAKVDIQYTDGTSDSFVMGNEAGETSGRYLLKDGVVYITASYSSGLLETPFYFFETDVYTVADRVEETVDSEGSSSTSTLEDVLYHMELSGANAAEPIVIDYDSSKVSSYLITQPVMAESGTNTLTEIATALKSLSAEAVVAAGRTQETLEQYGLAEPYAQITFDMNGEGAHPGGERSQFQRQPLPDCRRHRPGVRSHRGFGERLGRGRADGFAHELRVAAQHQQRQRPDHAGGRRHRVPL